ncbi:MAG: di-trans,poly-cis-decaprenylcistransferase [Bacilli bacterium]|jgi:undecaprenyl diphosphate synthase|nr:di-trans,poly-cis-decaprenylcistransferase [Bacilli bacterium]
MKENPKHVAIIMDGNGRWAKKRMMPRTYGHKQGSENLQKLSFYIFDQGIQVLSIFCFSTENFKRPDDEVNYLMNLFVEKFHNEFAEYKKKNIKVVFSGRRENLRSDVLEAMDKITEETKDNDRAILNFCLNYGGQYEVIDAMKKVISSGQKIDDLTPEEFMHFFYQDLPPIDYLIRTSGENRLSNFMLYQASYAEIYFPEVHFPDFDEKEFDKALDIYHNRDRRFGSIKEK